ncbi:MAG: Hsp70 family protein [Actinomycetota bacterium]|nr:Hsp70 family protein [Actinomycetota bacterium]
MTYDLGIDVGTSYTAAAVARASGAIEVVGLGPVADNIPSVVHVDAEGRVIVGDAAERRAMLDPTSAARDFKRRLGDPTPVIVRGTPYSSESLTAKLLSWVHGRVTEREGAEPRSIVATIPANWGPYKKELFGQALRIAGLEGATTVTEPHAAALAYASQTRVPEGSIIGIYDLGGGTFDAAVLQKSGEGFDLLGETVGIEHLGGVDFDAAVFHHVRRALGDAWPAEAEEDPALLSPLVQLRRACVEAKELLSEERSATVPVMLPGLSTSVQITRADFEGLIRHRLGESLDALAESMRKAGVSADDLTTVLLVGGSSRVPIIGQTLRDELGVRVSSDTDPMYAVARGAAIAAHLHSGGAGAPAGTEPARPDRVVTVPPAATPPPPASTAPPPPAPAGSPGGPASAAAAGAAAGAGAAAAATSGGAPSGPRTTDPSTGPAPTGNGAPPPSGAPPSTPPPTGDVPITPAGGEERRRNVAPLIGVGVLVVVALIAGVIIVTSGGGDDDGEPLAAPGDASDTTAVDTDAGADADDAGTGTGDVALAASPDGMVEIPDGTYTLGVDDPDPTAESLTTTTDLYAYWIDEHEVTNADWEAFVVRSGAEPASSWPGGQSPDGEDDLPVLGVNFEWAASYCEALGKRLPTEAEWEVAARGPDGSLWPWGDDRNAVELPGSGTYPVGSVAENVSAFGVYDLTGNAWEWVADPYDPRTDDAMRVLRGGQNGYIRNNVSRLSVQADSGTAVGVAGFRCAADETSADVAAGTFDEVALPDVPMTPPTTAPPEGFLLQETFQDTTTGWFQGRTEGGFFGYHPNEYFHLDTTQPGEVITAPAPSLYGPEQSVTVGTVVFVERQFTGPEGTFEYGLTVRNDGAGNFIAFTVDPRNQRWRIVRHSSAGPPETIAENRQAIPTTATLEIRMAGDNFEFVIGTTTVTQRQVPGLAGSGVGFITAVDDDITRVHVHYDDFWVEEWTP